MLTLETIRRKVDETICDWCGAPLYQGDRVYYDLAEGTAYCSRACGAQEVKDEPIPTWQPALFAGIGDRSLAAQGELFGAFTGDRKPEAPPEDAPGQTTFDADRPGAA